jgi:hypothetical protein
MDAVLALCGLNLLLCLWIVRLQNKIAKMRWVLEVLSEGMARVADGEVEIVRTADGIKAVKKEA